MELSPSWNTGISPLNQEGSQRIRSWEPEISQNSRLTELGLPTYEIDINKILSPPIEWNSPRNI
jgi:hypothetical protein